ncbi:MAG: hypothetical protein HQL87_02130 [Magnetococcales bacterium]|nr:hypothetical protein [Magnetococcales bacterium]
MSVNLLLCEGGSGSPDVRLLGKLLGGVCMVKPMGGKYGMGNRVKAHRDVLGSNAVSGLLDGDFLPDWQEPQGISPVWTADGGKTSLGWRWERKEIENYLLDPIVVARALGEQSPDPVCYRRALESARDTIAVYQAARIALSASRLRFEELPSSFGPARGKDAHCFPEQLDEVSCRCGIAEIVANHHQMASIPEEDVLNAFQIHLLECRPGGNRYKNYLFGFSGKDLFFALEGWFKESGFAHPNFFREKVLKGIENTTDDIADWLPEWKALQQLVSQT